MSKYIMRLDDAAMQRDIEKWNKIESLLDKYRIKPLIGVIPDCRDKAMCKYTEDGEFWLHVKNWMNKGYAIALHGYQHVYCTHDGGMNPINYRSEFAGLTYEEQKEKIEKGVSIMREHGINPKIFFAPSHTFDFNTLKALETASDIRIISDTIANKPYKKYGFTFVPQQSGMVRRLPFSVITFCYHPNTMTEDNFKKLEKFLKVYSNSFIPFPMNEENRGNTLYDTLLKKIYFFNR